MYCLCFIDVRIQSLHLRFGFGGAPRQLHYIYLNQSRHQQHTCLTQCELAQQLSIPEVTDQHVLSPAGIEQVIDILTEIEQPNNDF